MYLIFFDTETTGLNPAKHRIVEIAYKVVDSITGKCVIGYESIVSHSLEIWAQADPGSLEINGFTWEESLLGKTEQVVASEIANDLNHLGLSTQGGVFICQNPSFDRAFFLHMIDADLQRHYGWPYHWLDLASMFWTMRMQKDRNILHTIKESDLSKKAIATFFGIPDEPHPHRAMNGVKHLISCYEAMFGPFGE